MHAPVPSNGVSSTDPTALSRLFARFVTGLIPESSWTRMMSVLDESETTTQERFALANFLNDACTDLGPDAVEIPGRGEVEDLVTMMRAA